MDTNDNPILQPSDIHSRLMIGNYQVQRYTVKTVTVALCSSGKDLGYKVGGEFRYTWDGTGYKRQGQYLRKNNIK